MAVTSSHLGFPDFSSSSLVHPLYLGRGRGMRAKCQLRRSGVSQTRHRKQRRKYCLAMNIQDSHKALQDIEMYHTVQNSSDYSSDSSLDDIDDYDVADVADFIGQPTSSPVKSIIPDIMPMENKSKMCDNKIKQTRTNYYEDYADEMYNMQKDLSRLRLISECSVDSDDSLCIIFDVESDTSRKTDDHDEMSYDIETEAKEYTPKVKFNLIPIVHTMVQWDYAYRAARKGPWEEMARDRERFKARINCIASVLNPILTNQHRFNIWQERFAQRK